MIEMVIIGVFSGDKYPSTTYSTNRIGLGGSHIFLSIREIKLKKK